MDEKAHRTGLIMMLMGVLIGIAGLLIWMYADGNVAAYGIIRSAGYDARMLMGLSAVTIMLGTMMFFGSMEDRAETPPRTAGV